MIGYSEYENLTLAEKAERFAEEAHAGQIDEDGDPVIRHPRAVALRCETEEEKAAAFLHDVLEDTAKTADEIRAVFGDRIADAVEADTRQADETYGDYLERVKRNPLALRVKLADLLHNIERGWNSGNAERLKKHTDAFRTLAEEWNRQNPDGQRRCGTALYPNGAVKFYGFYLPDFYDHSHDPNRYEFGILFYDTGTICRAGVFQRGGLRYGKEYYPNGQLMFEGEYNDREEHITGSYYGPAYPLFGRFYGEDGTLYYDGHIPVRRKGGVGYPYVVLPNGEEKALH